MDQYTGIFITISAGGLLTAIGAWITMSVKVAKIEAKYEFLQGAFNEEKTNTKTTSAAVNTKLDQILTKTNEIEITLAQMGSKGKA